MILGSVTVLCEAEAVAAGSETRTSVLLRVQISLFLNQKPKKKEMDYQSIVIFKAYNFTFSWDHARLQLSLSHQLLHYRLLRCR